MSNVIGKVFGDVVQIGKMKGVTVEVNQMCADDVVNNVKQIIEEMLRK